MLDVARPLLDLIGSGRTELDEVAARLARSPGAVVEWEDCVLLPPIPHPPSVRDALGFLEHARGCRRAYGRDPELGEVWYQVPAFYFGNPATVYGPYDDVPVAPGSRWFDFELEIAAVIGIGGGDLDQRAAQDSIAGYTFFCDWTARDLQRMDTALGIGQGKGKDCGVTLGPWLLTSDEVEDRFAGEGLDLVISAAVNGQELARGTTASMDWTFAEIISFVSRGTTLRAGDVIGSGTLPGGCLLEHLNGDPATYERWLRPGDVVSLTGDLLGRTAQRIVPGPEVHRLSSGY
ncbi:fumarylacetoacetate hydrolase family protein [Micromonospora sp. CPCC 206060]|uniref:fumarylacetoacetate hydrolase family protein n=1 Tax=Micromonospora sp. CPCC 206060 TaxID=3122406 RepID=UPI002FEFF0FB